MSQISNVSVSISRLEHKKIVTVSQWYSWLDSVALSKNNTIEPNSKQHEVWIQISSTITLGLLSHKHETARRRTTFRSCSQTLSLPSPNKETSLELSELCLERWHTLLSRTLYSWSIKWTVASDMTISCHWLIASSYQYIPFVFNNIRGRSSK